MSFSREALFERLLEKTPFSPRELSILIATAPNRYKDHYIEKRNGRGKRLISQPTAELKLLQRILIAHELSNLQIHDAATAYRRGGSIRDHAIPHAGERYLLKLDFKDFFPSLKEQALKHCLNRDTDYSEIELWMLSQLLLRRPSSSAKLCLSIGAPSSPHISNYLMYEFDVAVAKLCRSGGANYTRYADDLAISTSLPGRLDEIQNSIRNLLDRMSYLGLKFNEEKTVNVSTKSRRTLVGLTLSNEGHVSIGRDAKRRLRAAMHSCVNGNLTADEVMKLRGTLSFVLSVDSKFVKELCARYGFRSVQDVGSSKQ